MDVKTMVKVEVEIHIEGKKPFTKKFPRNWYQTQVVTYYLERKERLESLWINQKQIWPEI
jgi:hypothetical protein